MNATINNQSAASATPAAEPIDYRKRIHQLLIEAAQDKPIDRAELKEILFEVGRDKRWWDRMLQMVSGRRQAVTENDRQQEQVVERNRLQSERESVSGQCEAEVEKLRAERLAQLEAEFYKLREPLRKCDAANGARLAELAGVQVDSRFRDAMARSADPRIQWKIADLSKQILALQDEVVACQDQLKERREYISDIEYSDGGTPVKLNGRTFIDREWWQRQRDGAEATMDDETAGERSRDKASRLYFQAVNRLKVIDTAKRRINEISGEQHAIQERIEQIKAQEIFWRNFAIDWKD